MASHVVLLPLSEEADEEVASELAVQHLREEVQVGNNGCLQNNRHVARVEKLHVKGRFLPTHLLADQSKLDFKALEVDDNKNHEDGRHQVHDVRSVLAPEGLLESGEFILLRHHKVEQSDDSTLKLSTLLSADCHR